MSSDEIKYRIFKYIEGRPKITQRELAKKLEISLGKTHYCLKALVEKGWIKAGNFRQNPNKSIYAYLLTPSGAREKTRITLRFLKYKMEEYEALKHEIIQLRYEVDSFDNKHYKTSQV